MFGLKRNRLLLALVVFQQYFHAAAPPDQASNDINATTGFLPQKVPATHPASDPHSQSFDDFFQPFQCRLKVGSSLWCFGHETDFNRYNLNRDESCFDTRTRLLHCFIRMWSQKGACQRTGHRCRETRVGAHEEQRHIAHACDTGARYQDRCHGETGQLVQNPIRRNSGLDGRNNTPDGCNGVPASVHGGRSEEAGAQNTALLRDDANLRLEPGRNTKVMRRLAAETKVEVLERKTLPRPNFPAPDVWIKVRVSPTEVGWLLGGALDYEAPAGIGGYMEGSNYSAIKPLNTVEDSELGPIIWYVVGERRPGAPPEVAFDGIRVFTWNLKKHRYETAYRIKGIRGAYPLAVGKEGSNPTFQFSEMADDGSLKPCGNSS
jgi:hypothetical protein